MIKWNSPASAPSDYRLVWARSDLDFLSYRFSNEAHRGNEYPSGGETALTLTGLTEGASYKVMLRARYHNAGAGPWTAEQVFRVPTAGQD